MEFKIRIKELREEKEMNITQLAVVFDLKEAGVRAWENGRTKPSADTLIKLSEYFNCSTDYLLGRTEYRNQADRKSTEQKSREVHQALEGLPLCEKKTLTAMIDDELYSYLKAKELDSCTAYNEGIHKQYIESLSLIAGDTRSAIDELSRSTDAQQTVDARKLSLMQKGQQCGEALANLYKAMDKEIDNIAQAREQ